jgi:hypothetical protein
MRNNPTGGKNMNNGEARIANDFEILSPWADADPVPLKGISARLTDLEGKKIGLFTNSKRAAPLALSAVERRLKERYPSLTTSWYTSTQVNTPEIKTQNSAKFEAWVGGVDAVVLGVGD